MNVLRCGLAVLLALALALPALAQTPTHTLDSSTPTFLGDFGASVTILDGFGGSQDYLVVGAGGEAGPSGQAGAGAVYFFWPDGSLVSRFTSPNAAVSGGFGFEIAQIGDVNRNSSNDLAIGAPYETYSGAFNAGRVYLDDPVFGLITTLESPNPEMDGHFGWAIALVGDVDDDDIDDFIVGAPEEDDDAGRAYVYASQIDHAVLLHTLFSPDPDALLGYSVDGAGDLNGDGVGDLVAGAPGAESDLVASAGRAYVYSGASSVLLYALDSPDPELVGGFGSSVAEVGDLNGDSIPDLLVGAPGEDASGVVNAGRAYVYSGASGALLYTLESPNPETEGHFGVAVVGVGESANRDVDGDGTPDFLVGTDGDNAGAGGAYLFSGATGSLIYSLGSPTPTAEGFYGSALASADDLDADGRPELMVGAHWETAPNGITKAGRAYAYSLDAPGTLALTLAAPQDWRLVAPVLNGLSYDALLDPLWTQGLLHGDLSSGDPNVFLYDETTAGDADLGWTPLPDQLDVAPLGQSFALYAFEDDDLLTPGTQGGFPKTITASSIAYPSDFAFSVTYTPSGAVSDDGWNAIGNPFPETLDWDAPDWTKAGLDNVVYVYDPALGQYLTWNGTTGSLGDGLLAPFQGFWVKTYAADPTLVAPMEAQTTGGIFHGRTGGSSGTPVLALSAETDLGEQAYAGQAFVMFSDDGLAGRDPFDAYKLAPFAPSYLSLFTTADDGTLLDINSLPLENGLVEIPLGVSVVEQGQPASATVTLTWPTLTLPPAWTATLVDTQTSEEVDLRSASSYVFTVEGGSRLPAPARREALAPPTPQPMTAAEALVGSGARFVLVIGASAVAAEGDPVAETFGLEAAYPNPFTARTTLRYALEREGPVRLAVYDVLGREVLRLVDGEQAAGRHEVVVDGARLPSGLYLVRLEAGGRVQTRRVVRLD